MTLNPPQGIGFILWDSLKNIKIDSRGKPGKTWQTFVAEIEKVGRFVNKGFDFEDNYKGIPLAINFIKSEFKTYKKNISDKSASLLLELVGFKRALLSSEIQKLAIYPEQEITEEFITEACFVSSSTSLYKLQIALNNGNLTQARMIIEEMVDQGIHPIVIADSLMKKMRWITAIVELWNKDYSWSEIETKIMEIKETRYKNKI